MTTINIVIIATLIPKRDMLDPTGALHVKLSVFSSALAQKIYISPAAPSPFLALHPSARGKFSPQCGLWSVTLTPRSFTLTSEDSSEVAFLLVENYNYDRSCWPSGRQGIFGAFLVITFSLFVAALLHGRGRAIGLM